MLIGLVDLLEKHKIYGWAYNPESPGEYLHISVKLDSKVIGRGVANVFRMDLPKANIGEGDHAFEISLPPDVTSFRGITVTAESTTAGSLVLPIETEHDRKTNQALAEQRRQYDKTLSGIKALFDASDTKLKAVEEELTVKVADLSKRVEDWETRMEANEVFLVRIDETLTRIVAEQAKRKRKRFLGIF